MNSFETCVQNLHHLLKIWYVELNNDKAYCLSIHKYKY